MEDERSIPSCKYTLGAPSGRPEADEWTGLSALTPKDWLCFDSKAVYDLTDDCSTLLLLLKEEEEEEEEDEEEEEEEEGEEEEEEEGEEEGKPAEGGYTRRILMI